MVKRMTFSPLAGILEQTARVLVSPTLRVAYPIRKLVQCSLHDYRLR